MHVCNPSYSGGRNQKDYGQSQPEENSLQDPILKISNTKHDWWSGQVVEFLPNKCEVLS
jgi:hypothetical protein